VSQVSPEPESCEEELSEYEEEVGSLTIPDQFGPLGATVSLSVGLDITASVGVMRDGAIGRELRLQKGKDTKYVIEAIPGPCYRTGGNLQFG